MSDLEFRQKEFAEKHRITLDQYKKLVSSMSYEEVVTCLELLKARRHRSEFRQRKELQIRNWLVDASISLKPLSMREYQALKPKWPVRYNLPS